MNIKYEEVLSELFENLKQESNLLNLHLGKLQYLPH